MHITPSSTHDDTTVTDKLSTAKSISTPKLVPPLHRQERRQRERVCVCVRERGRERGREGERGRERERKRERGRECERGRERGERESVREREGETERERVRERERESLVETILLSTVCHSLVPGTSVIPDNGASSTIPYGCAHIHTQT